MSLKELQDDAGEACFVDPSEVTGIQRRDSVRAMCWLSFRRQERLCVRGTPREVAAALFAQEDSLKRQDVVDAITYEWRMALGWEGMSAETRSSMLCVRVGLRNVADRLRLTLDETLINTPLPEEK